MKPEGNTMLSSLQKTSLTSIYIESSVKQKPFETVTWCHLDMVGVIVMLNSFIPLNQKIESVVNMFNSVFEPLGIL